MSEVKKSPVVVDRNVLEPYLSEFRLQVACDGFHIQWAKGNPHHPRNWSLLRKVHDASLIIFLELFTTAISTAGSTTAHDAAGEFGIRKELSLFLFVSIYLLGQGIGAIIFPPYSEAFGRKKLYIVSTALYSIACAIVASVHSLSGVVIGRLVSGFLSAIPTTVVMGSIEDMFNSKERVWMVCCWAVVSNLGLIAGPIMSTFVTADLGWRWLFYIATMVTGGLTILLLGIRESRPSLALAKEVAKLREVTQIETLEGLNPDETPDWQTFVRIALCRPARLFFTELIVFIVSIMSAVAIALVYLFTEVLPPVYEDMGFSPKHACLPFLAFGIGLSFGVLTRCLDLHIIKKHRQQGRPLLPEHKLAGFGIGMPILAVGLWVFAWCIPPEVTNVHWTVSALALALIGYSLNEIDYVLSGYLTDSYLSYAASGLAALSVVRALLSAALPLIAVPMFSKLGANVAVSVLAAIATIFCIVPPLFSRFGERIRARSQFAKYSLRMYNENSVDENGY
ncbi:hypothetical protein N8T08_006650 [Aspergillus melleus]|uniref:Uncharacterized protein n=1 Tax=Aspergillus melleus TaxID=138277 RepID=A0ACC3BFN1_9EURO|nr:hypothetical protein N8T08_006650 [Aspergillus melleus]